MNNHLNPLPLYWSALEKTMSGLMLRSGMRIEGKKIITTEHEIEILTRINLLAFGKASASMYLAAREIIGDKLFGRGLLVTHQHDLAVETDSEKEEVVFSSHPFISELSRIAGKKVKEFVSNHNPEDILVVLVSGGGSAMVALPTEGLALAEKIEFITRVMHMAVPEREVNVIKKALSDIKGGKLAEATKDKCIVNFILSDERNHQLSAISSGPTVCNDEIDPIFVMDRYNLWEVASDNIKKILDSHGRKVNIGASKPIFNEVIGAREDLCEAIVDDLSKFGFDNAYVLGNLHCCTPEDAIDLLRVEFLKIYDAAPPGRHIVVSTGEIQVKVDHLTDVKGGRNQHLVALFMAKVDLPFDFFFTAMATDGMDYLAGVHGAFYSSEMRQMINENRDFILREIARANTHVVHQRLGTLLEGEKTGTNLSDFILFAFEKV